MHLNVSTQGSGLSLVFVHGWGVNSGVWQNIVQRLALNYQVTTIDLPGFGLNAEVNLPEYSLDAVTEKISEAIATPSVIIGWSLGGLVASNLALRFPQNVLGLATVASSPCFMKNGSWPGIEAAVLKGFHQQLSIDIEKTINNFLKIQAMGSPHIRHDIKKLQAYIAQYPMPTLATLNESLTLLETVDLREQLHQISCPFLRLYGRLDALVPKTVVQTLNETLPESESYIFEKASHAPFISHEDEFIEKLNGWLTKKLS